MYDQSTVQILEFHRSMLVDEARMKAYLRAILHTVQPGDVVLDIGSGTGILAYFACLAGARHVYAVEQGPVIELAKAISRRNGYDDRVTFLRNWSTHVELPEKVDVVITETVGNAGFEEGILGWIIDAKKRFLSSEGRVIPNNIDLLAVPVQNAEDYACIADWSSNVFSLDITPGRAVAANNLIYTQLMPNSFLSDPVTLDTVVLNGDLTNHEKIGGATTFTVTRKGRLHGLACWFRTELIPGLSLTNHPPNPAPSWSHIYLPLKRAVTVTQGQELAVEIYASDNAAHWHWQVEGEIAPSAQGTAGISLHQSTYAGQLVSITESEQMQTRPVRNETAEIDLLILRQFDGKTTVAEIARQLKTRFPYHFSNYAAAIERVGQILSYYGCMNDQRQPIDHLINQSQHQQMEVTTL